MKMPDKESIQGFFISHVEKLCFAVVVICFLLLMWKAFSLPKLEVKPEQLKSSVESARNKLESTVPSNTIVPSYDFLSAAEKATAPVDMRSLAMNINFDHPIFQPRDKRGQPPILMVRDLKVSSGNGPLGTNNYFSQMDVTRITPRAGKIKKNGIRWALVTGLIPFKDQEKKFTDTFKNAQVKTANDVPVYRGYFIERAEINPAKPTEIKWVKLDMKAAFLANKDLASSGSSGEVVDNKYLIQNGTFGMAMPLPTIGTHRWGKDAAHDPEIPIIRNRGVGYSDFDDDMTPDEIAAAETAESEMSGLNNPNGVQLFDETGMPINPNDVSDPANQARLGLNSRLEELPDVRLFRFLDTTVEAGKHYRYRVQVLLYNPNKDLEPRFVQNEEMVTETYLTSEWSQPSDVVVIPNDYRIFCVGDRSKQDPNGPTGQLMLVQFNDTLGIEISKTFEKLQAGRWLNFLNEMYGEKVETARVEMAGVEDPMMTGPGGRRVPPRQMRQPDKPKGPTTDFITNSLLLDFKGGDKVPSSIFLVPVRALILDSDGNIIIADESTDKPDVFVRTKEPVKEIAPTRGDELDPTGKRRPRPGRNRDDLLMGNMRS